MLRSAAAKLRQLPDREVLMEKTNEKRRTLGWGEGIVRTGLAGLATAKNRQPSLV
jgi:hypothetical protein